MKVTAHPQKIRQLLSQLMVINSQKAFLYTVPIEVTPDGLSVNDGSSGIISIHALYKDNYFNSYEHGNDSIIAITKEFYNMLGWGFNDDEITVKTEQNEVVKNVTEKHIIAVGSYDKQDCVIPDVFQKKVDFPIKTDEKIGIVPEKINPNVQFKISVDKLKFPPADRYNFIFTKDGTCKVVIGKGNVFTHTFEPDEFTIKDDLSISIDGGYFADMISNLSGDIWISVQSDVGASAIIISVVNDDYLLTYNMVLLSP